MIFEILQERKREENLAYFQMTHKKLNQQRLLYSILGVLIGGLMYWQLQTVPMLLAMPIGMFIGYKIPYYLLIQKRKQADQNNRLLFPEWLGTFIALIPVTGNVYKTLEATIPYTKEPLRTGVLKLVTNIQQENDRNEYMYFADFVGTVEASLVMDTIYQFSEYGRNSESLKTLEEMMLNLERNTQEEIIHKKIGAMENLGYLPLFLSMFFILGFVAIMFMEYLTPVLNAL